MGRHYYGDIEGKFWFAVQSSEAPSRFGGTIELSYSFNEEDIPQVEETLSNIEKNINVSLLDELFEKQGGYSEADLEVYGLTADDVKEYADYTLGKQILEYLKENGECNFWGQI
jgi:hypothetical protein